MHFEIMGLERPPCEEAVTVASLAIGKGSILPCHATNAAQTTASVVGTSRMLVLFNFECCFSCCGLTLNFWHHLCARFLTMDSSIERPSLMLILSGTRWLQATGPGPGAALLLHAGDRASPGGAICDLPGAPGFMGATGLSARARHAHPASACCDSWQSSGFTTDFNHFVTTLCLVIEPVRS